MYIRSLQIRDFMGFSLYRTEFKEGFSALMMGPSQGKTGLRMAMRAVLADHFDHNFALFHRNHSGTSEINLELYCGKSALRFIKTWTDGAVQQWTVENPDAGTVLDLTNQGTYDDWVRWFLYETQGWPVSEHDGETVLHNEWARGQYDFLMRLIFCDDTTMTDLMTIPISSLVGLRYVQNMEVRLNELIQKASEKVFILKSEENLVQNELSLLEQKRQMVLVLEKDLESDTELLQKLDERLIQTQHERVQAERITGYIQEKRSEITKLGFEITTYQNVMQNNVLQDTSEEEIRTMDRKARLYEKAIKEIETIEENIIQRRHLEKNLEGIEQEIQVIDRTHTGKLPPEIKTQKKAYESEARRLRLLLSKMQDDPSSMEHWQTEKRAHEEAYHQYTILKKTRQYMNQNNLQKLKSTTDKLIVKRQHMQDELDQIFASQHETQYQKLEAAVASDRQQALELKERMATAVGRKEKLQQDIQALQLVVDKHLSRADQKRREITSKRHLLFVRETVTDFYNAQIELRKNELSRQIKTHLKKFRVAFTSKQLFGKNKTNEPSLETIPISTSERILSEHIFAMTVLAMNLKNPIFFADENFSWYLTKDDRTEIEALADQLNFGQFILFEKN